METSILSGIEASKALYSSLESRISNLKNHGIVPGLAAVLVGSNPASEIYVKNKTKKIARSSISYTINLFFAVFWGCHCIWASASVRGHPREKHLVYVVGAGSRATHCKKRGSKRAASRRENGQKSFKMPRDRLFWRRFEPIEPPQRRTSFTMWPPTI